MPSLSPFEAFDVPERTAEENEQAQLRARQWLVADTVSEFARATGANAAAEVRAGRGVDRYGVQWDEVQQRIEDRYPNHGVDMNLAHQAFGQVRDATFHAGLLRQPQQGEGYRDEMRHVMRHVPLLGHVSEILHTQEEKAVRDRIQRGTATQEDYFKYQQRLAGERYEQDRSTWQRAVEATSILPTTSAELGFIGLRAGTAAGEAVAARLGGGALAQAAGFAVGGVAAHAATPLNSASSVFRQINPHVGEPDASAADVFRGLLDHQIEIITEMAGGPASEVAGWMGRGIGRIAQRVPGGPRAAAAATTLFNWAQSRGSTQAAQEAMKRIGFNGMMGEWLEERVGDVLRGASGVEPDYGWVGNIAAGVMGDPKAWSAAMDQLIVEGISIGGFGMFMNIAGSRYAQAAANGLMGRGFTRAQAERLAAQEFLGQMVGRGPTPDETLNQAIMEAKTRTEARDTGRPPQPGEPGGPQGPPRPSQEYGPPRPEQYGPPDPRQGPPSPAAEMERYIEGRGIEQLPRREPPGRPGSPYYGPPTPQPGEPGGPEGPPRPPAAPPGAPPAPAPAPAAPAAPTPAPQPAAPTFGPKGKPEFHGPAAPEMGARIQKAVDTLAQTEKNYKDTGDRIDRIINKHHKKVPPELYETQRKLGEQIARDRENLGDLLRRSHAPELQPGERLPRKKPLPRYGPARPTAKPLDETELRELLGNLESKDLKRVAKHFGYRIKDRADLAKKLLGGERVKSKLLKYLRKKLGGDASLRDYLMELRGEQGPPQAGRGAKSTEYPHSVEQEPPTEETPPAPEAPPEPPAGPRQPPGRGIVPATEPTQRPPFMRPAPGRPRVTVDEFLRRKREAQTDVRTPEQPAKPPKPKPPVEPTPKYSSKPFGDVKTTLERAGEQAAQIRMRNLAEELRGHPMPTPQQAQLERILDIRLRAAKAALDPMLAQASPPTTDQVLLLGSMLEVWDRMAKGRAKHGLPGTNAVDLIKQNYPELAAYLDRADVAELLQGAVEVNQDVKDALVAGKRLGRSADQVYADAQEAREQPEEDGPRPPAGEAEEIAADEGIAGTPAAGARVRKKRAGKVRRARTAGVSPETAAWMEMGLSGPQRTRLRKTKGTKQAFLLQNLLKANKEGRTIYERVIEMGGINEASIASEIGPGELAGYKEDFPSELFKKTGGQKLEDLVSGEMGAKIWGSTGAGQFREVRQDAGEDFHRPEELFAKMADFHVLDHTESNWDEQTKYTPRIKELRRIARAELTRKGLAGDALERAIEDQVGRHLERVDRDANEATEGTAPDQGEAFEDEFAAPDTTDPDVGFVAPWQRQDDNREARRLLPDLVPKLYHLWLAERTPSHAQHAFPMEERVRLSKEMRPELLPKLEQFHRLLIKHGTDKSHFVNDLFDFWTRSDESGRKLGQQSDMNRMARDGLVFANRWVEQRWQDTVTRPPGAAGAFFTVEQAREVADTMPAFVNHAIDAWMKGQAKIRSGMNPIDAFEMGPEVMAGIDRINDALGEDAGYKLHNLVWSAFDNVQTNPKVQPKLRSNPAFLHKVGVLAAKVWLAQNATTYPKAPPGPVADDVHGTGPGAYGQARWSPAHTSTLRGFTNMIKASNVGPEQQAEYADRFAKVLTNANENVARILGRNIRAMFLYNSAQQLTDMLATFWPAAEEIRQKGNVIGGAYAYQAGNLEVDGDVDTKTLKMSAAEVYAHEFGHAIDNNNSDPVTVQGKDGYWNFSARLSWQDAAAAEAHLVSDYATEHPSEAFAEFSRLVLGKGISADALAQRYPLMTQFWLDNNLMPQQGGGPLEELKELFSESIHDKDGRHGDVLVQPQFVASPAAPQPPAVQEAAAALGTAPTPEKFRGISAWAVDYVDNALGVLDRFAKSVKALGFTSAIGEDAKTVHVGLFGGEKHMSEDYAKNGIWTIKNGRRTFIGKSLEKIMEGFTKDDLTPAIAKDAPTWLQQAARTMEDPHDVTVADVFMMARHAIDEQASGDPSRQFVSDEKMEVFHAAMREFMKSPEQVARLSAQHDLLTKHVFNASILARAEPEIHSLPLAPAHDWIAKRPTYLPTTRLEEASDFVSYPGPRVSDKIHPRGTSERTIMAPLKSAKLRLRQTAAIIAQQIRGNSVAPMLRMGLAEWGEQQDPKLGLQNEVDGVVATQQLKNQYSDQEIDDMLESMGPEAKLLMKARPWSTRTPNLWWWRDETGTLTNWKINDRALYELLTHQQGNGNASIEFLRWASRIGFDTKNGRFNILPAFQQLQRAGATTFSLAYHVHNTFNPLRDPLVFFTNTSKPGSIAELPTMWGRVFAGEWAILRNRVPKDVLFKVFKNFRGDATRMFDPMTIDTPTGFQWLNSTAGYVTNFFRWAGAGELAPRLLEFKNILEKEGWTQDRLEKEEIKAAEAYARGEPYTDPIPYYLALHAMNHAGEVTVPFPRQGILTREINAMSPFVGPTIASTSKIIRQTGADPARVGTALAIYLGLRMMHYFLVKDKKWYQELSAYDRYNNFVIETPFGLRRIPGARGSEIPVGGMMIATLDALRKNRPDLWGLLKQSYDAYAPASLVPPPLKVGYEIATNRDWMGRPIVPGRDADLPAFNQAMQYQLPYAVRQFTGGRAEPSARGLGLAVAPPVRPTRSVDEVFSRLQGLTQDRLLATRQGRRFDREAQYQRLNSGAEAIRDLARASRRPELSESRREELRARQLEIARRVLDVD